MYNQRIHNSLRTKVKRKWRWPSRFQWYITFVFSASKLNHISRLRSWFKCHKKTLL